MDLGKLPRFPAQPAVVVSRGLGPRTGGQNYVGGSPAEPPRAGQPAPLLPMLRRASPLDSRFFFTAVLRRTFGCPFLLRSL
jgi:hypothetical protein